MINSRHHQGANGACRALPGIALLVCLAVYAGSAVAAEYGIRYDIRPEPSSGYVFVEMRVTQDDALLREVRMGLPDKRFDQIDADGQLIVDNGRAIWMPPSAGGNMRWRVRVASERKPGAFDAVLFEDWSIFRGSDIIPPAATRTATGARSATSFKFSLPNEWSAVTEYARDGELFLVDRPDRRFDRPTGWMLLGKIGSRTDIIGQTRVTVAAPRGQSVRRMDYLALLRWTLPEVSRAFHSLPQRLTIIAADDPMWRGGLSAPASIFIHADRPLISENATSTLLHEVVHVVLGLKAEKGADWIVEGLAEYYSLEFLRRSGTISEERYARGMDKLATWGNDSDGLCTDRSAGATTASAAVLFHQLDREIREKSANAASLDDVTAALVSQGDRINLADVRKLSEEVAGFASTTLNSALKFECESDTANR